MASSVTSENWRRPAARLATKPLLGRAGREALDLGRRRPGWRLVEAARLLVVRPRRVVVLAVLLRRLLSSRDMAEGRVLAAVVSSNACRPASTWH